jgi:Mrp family chromosome partitioning ATPase
LLHIGNCIHAVNIAVALAKEFKLQVGLLDADIYGPSVPTMMNLHAKPEVSEGTCWISFSTSMVYTICILIYVKTCQAIHLGPWLSCLDFFRFIFYHDTVAYQNLICVN